MKTDAQIQQDVIDQLKWNPLLNATEIGVAVKNGIVTLSGQVDSYLRKTEAEKEAQKVAGVKAIAEDIHVGISPLNKRTDTEIAQAVLKAFEWHSAIPSEQIQVKVEDGTVILTGEVAWEYQREITSSIIAELGGVQQVVNQLRLKPAAMPADAREKIQAAFERSATLDANNIQVVVSGNHASLQGQVHTLAEKKEAEKAIWQVPGVGFVHNELEVMGAPKYAH